MDHLRPKNRIDLLQDIRFLHITCNGQLLDQKVLGEVEHLTFSKGKVFVAFQVDVTNQQSVARLADQVVTKFGTVDILVNAQGINTKRPAVGFPVEDWDQLFNVNVKGTMLACSEFGKVMVEKKKGKVINVSSVRGVRATLWGGNELLRHEGCSRYDYEIARF
jgi:gluconate 5-dehydrogenase